MQVLVGREVPETLFRRRIDQRVRRARARRQLLNPRQQLRQGVPIPRGIQLVHWGRLRLRIRRLDAVRHQRLRGRRAPGAQVAKSLQCQPARDPLTDAARCRRAVAPDAGGRLGPWLHQHREGGSRAALAHRPWHAARDQPPVACDTSHAPARTRRVGLHEGIAALHLQPRIGVDVSQRRVRCRGYLEPHAKCARQRDHART